MYELRVISKNKLTKIKEPIKARSRDFVIRSVVDVMDEEGNWHVVGHSFFDTDARFAKDEINRAIERKRDTIEIDIW